MKISTKGRYALRVMLDLAEQNTTEWTPLKDVSARQGVPIKYLEQIIAILTKAGFLKSSRGNGGGYRLKKAPEQYSIGDILRATEGSLAPVACLDDIHNQCTRSGTCQTLPFWSGLANLINEYVDTITLKDLMKNGDTIELL